MSNPWLIQDFGLWMHRHDHRDEYGDSGSKVVPKSDTFTFWDADCDEEIDSTLTMLDIPGTGSARKCVFCYKSGHADNKEQIWSDKIYIQWDAGPGDEFRMSFRGWKDIWVLKRYHRKYPQMAEFQRWLARLEASQIITDDTDGAESY